MNTCAIGLLLGGVSLVPTPIEMGSAPSKFLCAFSSDQTTARKEIPVDLLVGTGPSELVTSCYVGSPLDACPRSGSPTMEGTYLL